MAYRDLRDFSAQLETRGELLRVGVPVDPRLEMTELSDRVLKAGGPALLFEHPTGERRGPSGATIPALCNLFGTPQRVARAMGAEGDDWRGALREIGKLLAFLKEPEPPKGLKDAWQNTRPVFMKVLDMAPKERSSGPCQEVVWEGADVDLARFPVQTCWPGDAGPLITWGLTVTRGPHKKRQNLGIYRQQVIARDKVILRWLAQRGGALDFRDHALAHPGTPFPVAVALGADPGDDPGRGDAGARFAVRVPVRRPAARRAHRDRQVPVARPVGAGDRGDRARRFHPPRRERPHRLRDGRRRAVRRPHRLLQRRRALPGADDRAHHAAPRPDLPLDVHGQAAGRAGGAGRRAERSVRAAAAEAVSGDRRLLPAAGGLLVPARRRFDEEAVSGTREARDVRRVELPAPVHVHEDDHRHRRRRRHPRLEGRRVGADDARRSGARHADRRIHADRLPRLRVAGRRARQQDGHRRDQQVAGRDEARVGTPIAMDTAVKARVDALFRELGL